VRVVAARLTEGDPARAVRDSLLSARVVLAGRDDCWPYLLVLGPDLVGVAVAGPTPVPAPDPVRSPWQAVGTRRWVARRPLPAVPDGDPADLVPVAVGVHDDGLVLLDIGRSPGVVSVDGEPEAAGRLVAAIATQIATTITGAAVDTVLIAAGIPGFPGHPPLADVLAAVERRAAGAGPGRTVLVCARPDAGEAARLTALAEREPGLLVLISGYVPGSRWRLRVTPAGRVVAPELDIDADGEPLWPGLVKALGGRGMRLPDPERR
jgi:hypothetical protein